MVVVTVMVAAKMIVTVTVVGAMDSIFGDGACSV